MDKNSPNTFPKVAVALGLMGVLISALGMFQVHRGDITIAPILLVVAYLVIFPLALTRLR